MGDLIEPAPPTELTQAPVRQKDDSEETDESTLRSGSSAKIDSNLFDSVEMTGIPPMACEASHVLICQVVLAPLRSWRKWNGGSWDTTVSGRVVLATVDPAQGML